MQLTLRQEEVLKAIIEEYAETATPVGSITLAKLFDVSSATIRAEMGRLEHLGLLSQPYTSAGRIPTDAGYRWYVNTLTREEDSTLLPQIGELNNRHTRVLEARVMASNRMEFAIKGAVDSLVEITGNLGLGTIGDRLYLAGISKLFNQPEYENIARVQAVATLLDNLEPWLREAAPGKPLNIFIGQENPIGKSSDASLIISKFRSPLSDRSYIGVLGPTRQNYSQVMSLVYNAGNMLEECYGRS